MKQINTLVTDIYDLVQRKERWFDEEAYSNELATRLAEQFEDKTKATLRLSQMGPKCPKALWHSIHTPSEAQSLPPWVRIKYSYGHMIEALVITLAKAAGHSVVGEQDEIILDGVHGHRDCVVDGCTADVKSMSSIGFSKLKAGDYSKSDSFGYLDQLDGYVVGSYLDPLVTVKDKGYIIGVDKQLGHIHVYEHKIREDSIRDRIRRYKHIVNSVRPPACECGLRTQGKSGNIELDVRASYSPFKFCCFPQLRVFLYASGPVYLTRVVRKPDVTEVDRYGQVITS